MMPVSKEQPKGGRHADKPGKARHLRQPFPLMQISPETTVRDLVKALGYKPSEVRFHASARRSPRATVSTSWTNGEKPHIAVDKKETIAQITLGEYRKVFLTLARKAPQFPPRSVKISMYMPDGKLVTESVERRSKTELDDGAVSDAITELTLRFNGTEKRIGTARLPDWLR